MTDCLCLYSFIPKHPCNSIILFLFTVGVKILKFLWFKNCFHHKLREFFIFKREMCNFKFNNNLWIWKLNIRFCFCSTAISSNNKKIKKPVGINWASTVQMTNEQIFSGLSGYANYNVDSDEPFPPLSSVLQSIVSISLSCYRSFCPNPTFCVTITQRCRHNFLVIVILFLLICSVNDTSILKLYNYILWSVLFFVLSVLSLFNLPLVLLLKKFLGRNEVLLFTSSCVWIINIIAFISFL